MHAHRCCTTLFLFFAYLVQSSPMKGSSFTLFFFFWLHSAFIALCGLSLVAVSRAYSFVAVPGLLTVVASLVDHRLQGL